MYGKLQRGEHYTEICSAQGKHGDMLMDIGIYELENECINLYDGHKETAVLLLSGRIRLQWQGNEYSAERSGVFDAMPVCLHCPRGVEITVAADGKASVLVQKTENEKSFEAVLYKQQDVTEERAGDGFMEDTANRLIRTIFDYSNAPYSNMVMGEVISLQGRWSSYPPHHHDQPEVYYYQFDKEQGFGCAMVGEEAYRVEHHSYITIPGGLAHPQATAPGYRMYFCWMIRHLDGNPWTDRIFEPEHKWMV